MPRLLGRGSDTVSDLKKRFRAERRRVDLTKREHLSLAGIAIGHAIGGSPCERGRGIERSRRASIHGRTRTATGTSLNIR
jgi:hypothetical protein